MTFLNRIDKINQFVNRYLTVFVILMVILSLAAPGLLTPAGSFSFGKIAIGSARSFNLSLINVMLMIMMLGAGTSITLQEVLQVAKEPVQLTITVIAKYLVMAAAAWLCTKVLPLGDEMAFGLILLGAMPPGIGASVLVGLAGGEVSFGVALCMICTLIAPIASPALTLLFGGTRIQVDFLNMVISIVLVVLIPILAGIVIKSIFRERLRNFKIILSSFCLISVLLIIGCSTAPNKDVILSAGSLLAMAGITLNFVLAAALFRLLAGVLHLSRARSNAAMITSVELNNALAVGIAAGFTAAPAASVPPIIAVSLNFALAAALTNILANQRDDNP